MSKKQKNKVLMSESHGLNIEVEATSGEEAMDKANRGDYEDSQIDPFSREIVDRFAVEVL